MSGLCNLNKLPVELETHMSSCSVVMESGMEPLSALLDRPK
jgi:hypothetical protein